MPPLPPHLPYNSCNIKSHEHWQRLQIFVVVTIVGLLAGAAGALTAIAWIWPQAGGEIWLVSKNRGEESAALAENLSLREARARLYSVYGGSQTLNNLNYFNTEDKLGDAAAVGSDGWLALWLSDGRKISAYKKWRVFSPSGDLFQVDSAIYDQHAHLIYLKVSPLSKSGDKQLKVTSFEDSIAVGTALAVFDRGFWRSAVTGELAPGIYGAPHLDSAPSDGLELSGDFIAGAPVFSVRGRLAGFVLPDRRILPISAVTRILPSVLNSQKLSYPSFGVFGWFSSERPMVSGAAGVTGFVVSRVSSRQSVLRVGDAVLEINGQIAERPDLWYNTGTGPVRLKVLRRGQTLEISSPVITISE